MAQASAITLADGQATPVNVTFSPEQVTPALTKLVDRSTGIAAKYRRVNVRFGEPARAGQPYKTSFNVSVPVWGVLTSGAEGVVRTLRARVEYELPDGSTDAERKDLHAFVVNALGNALVRGSLRDLDPMY